MENHPAHKPNLVVFVEENWIAWECVHTVGKLIFEIGVSHAEQMKRERRSTIMARGRLFGGPYSLLERYPLCSSPWPAVTLPWPTFELPCPTYKPPPSHAQVWLADSILRISPKVLAEREHTLSSKPFLHKGGPETLTIRDDSRGIRVSIGCIRMRSGFVTVQAD